MNFINFLQMSMVADATRQIGSNEGIRRDGGTQKVAVEVQYGVSRQAVVEDRG